MWLCAVASPALLAAVGNESWLRTRRELNGTIPHFLNSVVNSIGQDSYLPIDRKTQRSRLIPLFVARNKKHICGNRFQCCNELPHPILLHTWVLLALAKIP